MTPVRATSTRETKQSRSAERQQAMLEAAARLLIDEGPAAITHRRVAAEAGLPSGSANYYFPTKDGLYAAAVRAAEAVRGESARRYAEGIARRRRTPAATARLLIETYYAPGLRPDVVAVRLEPMLSADRTPGLHEIMAAARPGLLESLRIVLRRSGYPSVAAGPDLELIATTIDAALLHASGRGDTDPIVTAETMVGRLLELAASAT